MQFVAPAFLGEISRAVGTGIVLWCSGSGPPICNCHCPRCPDCTCNGSLREAVPVGGWALSSVLLVVVLVSACGVGLGWWLRGRFDEAPTASLPALADSGAVVQETAINRVGPVTPAEVRRWRLESGR